MSLFRVKLNVGIADAAYALSLHIGIRPVNGIRLRVIVGDENHAVRADAVIIVRRHLEVIAALDLSEKRARHFAVFVLAQAVVIAEGRRRVKRLPSLAGTSCHSTP